jgi:excisionase family DNA binding protein
MKPISRLTDPVVSKSCTVDQLAEYLDATLRFVRNENAAGRLRARRLSARLIRIFPSDLQQWLDASATTPLNNKPYFRVAFHHQTRSPNEVRICDRRAPGKRMPLIRPKPYQSPLWAHLETIRKLRRKRQTWAAIALHLKESHGVENTTAIGTPSI